MSGMARAFSTSSFGSTWPVAIIPRMTPADRSDIVFTPGTSQAAIDSFFTYLANNDQLQRNAGAPFKRNNARAGWVNQLDLSFSQEIPGFASSHKAQIRLDIFNFLNLLDRNWGVERRADFPLTRSLANFAGVQDGKYVYNIQPYLVNGVYAPSQLNVNESFNPSQRWAATVTLRYEF